jgi:hypothetical protein
MKYLKMLGLAAVAAMALTAFAASTASATTLETNGVPTKAAETITATLEAGSSATLKDEFGTTTDTCTKSEVEGTSNAISGESPTWLGGTINKLTFENCSHTTQVDASGGLEIMWTKETKGEVRSTGAIVTVQSTFFGATATCKTGAGTVIGTLTGVKEGHAKIDINAAVNCGILGTASWTGTYSVTSPSGLGVES